MKFVRILIGMVAIILVLVAGLMIVLGNRIDRDRDDSLAATNAQNNAAVPTSTVTRLGSNVQLTRGTIEWISDGDTVRVNINGVSETVRLIGIDAPEESTTFASDCYAADAHAYLERLIDGRAVYLEADANDRDQYGRLLRYLWLPKDDGYVLVNQMIVARGYAAARIYVNDDLHAPELAAAELDAIANQRGIWGKCISDHHRGTAGAPESWDGRSDLDCRDFTTRVNAQAFYAATGGPSSDRFNLDVDRNGLVCHTRPPTEPLET